MRDRYVIMAALAIQAFCAVFFLSDILSSYVGLRSKPISWRLREVIEIGAAVGLMLGFVLGAVALKRSRIRQVEAETRLRLAAGVFMDLVEERFTAWELTPAEREVALFALKGLSISDIAGLRNTSDGTVKAQAAAVYRKAGVSGRPQFLSLFIEDLMDETTLDPARVQTP